MQRRQQRRLPASQRPQQHKTQHLLFGRRRRDIHAAKALDLASLKPKPRQPKSSRCARKRREKAKAPREEMHPHNPVSRCVA
jgi:hypothetical protein